MSFELEIAVATYRPLRPPEDVRIRSVVSLSWFMRYPLS